MESVPRENRGRLKALFMRILAIQAEWIKARCGQRRTVWA